MLKSHHPPLRLRWGAHSRSRVIAAVAGLVVLGFTSGIASAGGLLLYEVGSAENGLAAAGASARAQDAATVLTNPAGLTRLEGLQLLVGAQALYSGATLDPGPRTNVSGGDGGAPVGWFPGGSLFLSAPLGSKLRFGLGAYGNFGLGLEYDEGWVGRYYVEKATLLGATVQPTIAWRVSDAFSVGAGLVATYGLLDQEVAINNTPFDISTVPDARLDYEDEEWGYGANIGLLLAPAAGTRLGVQWTSEVGLDFSARPAFTGLRAGLQAILENRGLLDSDLAVGITVPQTARLSLYHEPGDRVSLLASVGWQQWSRFGRPEIGVLSDDPASLTADLGYDDTWHFSLGTQQRISPSLRLDFGAAYDTEFQDQNDIPLAVPSNAAFRLGAGAQFAAGRSTDLGLAVTYLMSGDLTVNAQGPVRGDVVGVFDDAAVWFLAANANFRF